MRLCPITEFHSVYTRTVLSCDLAPETGLAGSLVAHTTVSTTPNTTPDPGDEGALNKLVALTKTCL